MVKKTRKKLAATAEAAEAGPAPAAEAPQAGPAAAATPPSEGAARAAQDAEAGLDYDGDDGNDNNDDGDNNDDNDDNDDDDEEKSGESEESDDDEGRWDLGDAMDLEVQGPQNAPDSDLTSLSANELQELLYKEEITRNVVRLREGLESLPLSAVALLHLKTQEAAIGPTRDVSATSQLARKSKQTVKMRPVAPQQQQRTRRPKKGNKDRGEKNEMGFFSDGSFDLCTHPTCRNHKSHPLESCWVKQREEDGKDGKPARHHKKKRFRWVKERVSDSE